MSLIISQSLFHKNNKNKMNILRKNFSKRILIRKLKLKKEFFIIHYTHWITNFFRNSPRMYWIYDI